MSLTRREALSLGLSAAALSSAAILAAGRAGAATPPVFNAGGVALRGTDPVAFFVQGGPKPGRAAHAATWNGTTWHFESAENRERFLADPAAYAPQYGGYCAWAVSRGYTAPTVPEAWEIVDNRLYLNFSLGVRARWRRDIPGNIARANANWPGVLA
ncbi:MAG: YHS domain-containing (seleno)protein [Pseudomonadota bacterium]